MNDNLKKRLIGAIVLVSLAVIFIPMLLDGPGESALSDASGIPPKPDYQFRAIEIPLEVPAKPAPERVEVVETTEQAERAVEPQPAAQAPEAEAPAVEEEPQPVVKAPQPTPAAVAPAGGKAWVVQIGSFTNSNNAFALRDKLRKSGLPAFVEKVSTAEQTVFRVRVGPELTREAAEALQEKATPVAGSRGLVMQHP